MSELLEMVPEALDGERLDRVVALLGAVSRNRAGAAIDGGAVSVNGEPISVRAHRVHVGEQLSVSLTPPDKEAGPEPDPDVEVPVIHVDQSVVVVEKPAGLVVHPAPGNTTGTMVNGLMAAFPEILGVGSVTRPGIVHRLDRDTSGLLVVARNQGAYDQLVRQMADRSVRRRYRALSWGHFQGGDGLVDAPIGRSPHHRTRMAVVSNGRPARTRYRIDHSWEEPAVSMVSLVLETGRTHQIRVHLSSIGHPVVGDTTYSENRPDLGLGRQFLHASELAFNHPLDGRRVTFESQLPAELAELLERLGGLET